MYKLDKNNPVIGAVMKFLDSDSIFNKICNIVGNTQKSIKIASAWLKGNLLYELLNKLGNNVELSVILRASELQDLLIIDNNVFRKIKEKNGKIYINNRLHAKFIIVDDKEAILGSANFTDSGLSGYNEGKIEASFFSSPPSAPTLHFNQTQMHSKRTERKGLKGLQKNGTESA